MGRPDRIHFTCRVCRFAVRAPFERAGRRAKCPVCGTKIEVPLADEVAPPAPTTPPPVHADGEPLLAEVVELPAAGTPEAPLSLDDAPAAPRRPGRRPDPAAPDDEGPRRVEDTHLLPVSFAALGLPCGLVLSVLVVLAVNLAEKKMGMSFGGKAAERVVAVFILGGLALLTVSTPVAGWFLGGRVRRGFALDLEPGERLVARQRPFPFTGATTTLGGTVLFFVFGCLASDSSIKVMFRFTDTALPAWPFFTLAAVGAVASGAIFVGNLLTMLTVTDRRLVLKQPAGTRVLPLADVDAVSVSTPPAAARALDPEVSRFTALTVKTRHGAGEGLELRWYSVSEAFAREVERLARRARRAAVG